jgi:hypothetical protein
MSLSTDQSFNQLFEQCKEQLNYIWKIKCNRKEIITFMSIKSIAQICYRMRYSNTSQTAIEVIQVLYNKLLKSKGSLIKGFPNFLMYSHKNRAGLQWPNIWDAVSTDRIVNWMKHSHATLEEQKIVSAAFMRSEELQESNKPCMQCKTVRPWNGTMLGRLQEWITPTDFEIVGGKQNFGKRENDVAIVDLVTEKKDMKMIFAGCYKSKLSWLSQCVSDDDTTWIRELQQAGKFMMGKFVWYNYRDDKEGKRVTVRHENKWGTWALKIKVLLAKWKREQTPAIKPGKYFSELPVLESMDGGCV